MSVLTKSLRSTLINYVKPMFLCVYVVKEADETLVVKGAGEFFFETHRHIGHIEIHIEKAQKR
jgi:hypothetical protein